MFDYSFGFWQVLAMLFIAYYIGELVAQVRMKMAENALALNFKEVKVEISVIDNVWLAHIENDGSFIARANSYDELKVALSNLKGGHSYVTDAVKLAELIRESSN